jgi:hypothetical protein
MMKLALFVSLTVSSTMGFTPIVTKTNLVVPAATTFDALRMSASSIEPDKKSNDGWTGKPGYVRKSMEPVADKKISKLQRMTLQDVMIEPNYFLTYAVALLGPLIIWYHPCKYYIVS